jgi:hypothetical protein
MKIFKRRDPERVELSTSPRVRPAPRVLWASFILTAVIILAAIFGHWN